MDQPDELFSDLAPEGESAKAFSHDRTPDGKEEWLTPPGIIKALGEFDVDPCSPVKRPWDTAKQHFTIFDNGLFQPWAGRVWLNPPYGNQTPRWMRKLAEHGNGIALIYARTETGSFFPWVWDYADSIFFFDSRLQFYHVSGEIGEHSGGAPSCLVAYGPTNTIALIQAAADGKITGKLLMINPTEKP